MVSLPPSLWFALPSLASALMFVGCSGRGHRLPPPAPCDTMCGSSGTVAGGTGGSGGSGGSAGMGGSGGSGGSGGGAGGGGPAVDVSGTVVALTDPSFDVSVPFAGGSPVAYTDAAGAPQTVTPSAMGAFTATNVPSGNQWFTVVVTDPGTAAVTTLSNHDVDGSTPLTVPVTNADVYTGLTSQITANLPVPGSSLVFVRVTRAGVPEQGVVINLGGATAQAAFGTGAGIYDPLAFSTGAPGTIALIDTVLTGAAPATLSLTDNLGVTTPTLTVPTLPDAVTVVSVDLGG